MKKRGRGRPTKLTPKVAKVIATGVRNWLPLRYAAIMADVGPTTLHTWLASSGQEFREFREQIERAKAERTAELVDTVAVSVRSRKGKPGDPDRALKVLERLEPKDFGQQVRVQVEEELDAALARLETEFADEPQILERALAAVAGIDGAGPAHRAPRKIVIDAE